jgi:acyl phosphate:glycerol-3-phosphate acyltransferase
MYFLFLFLSLTFAYLSGSLNFAILITRWVRGIDIRQIGNKNPGTANVGREVGKGWAALVMAGDMVKGLIPLALAKSMLFPEENCTDYLALFLTGMSAIAGHCWPVFFRFRGGGGLATTIGIYMFFIPVEFLTALIIAFSTVELFLRKKKYAIGQLIPMIFVPLTPLLLILSNLLPGTYLFRRLKPMGHPWYVIAGIIALSAYVFFINIRLVLARFLKDNPI